MKTGYEWIKKLLGLICLFECWINYYHKLRKIKYVALINLIFILILTLVLSLLTYIFSIVLNENLIVSFNTIFLLYLFILFVIAFQNLFDTKFNIAYKTKILILSVFSGIDIKRCIIEFLFYLVSWVALTYLLSKPADNYIRNGGLKNTNASALMRIIMLIAFIIIFIVQVYGINDLYKKSKRKLVLYSISTLIALISTINSINNIYKNQTGYVDIFDFQFLALVFALIISIDKLFANYTTLITEYTKNDGRILCITMCEECNIKNINFDFIYNKIVSYIFNTLKGIKHAFILFKSSSIKRKLFFILYIISLLAIMLLWFKFKESLSQSMEQITIKVSDKLENLAYNAHLGNNGMLNILLVLLKYLVKVIAAILEIFLLIICLASIIDSISEIRDIVRDNIDKKKINIKMLQEQFKYLSNKILFLIVILIIPFVFFYELNCKLFEVVLQISICIYISAFIIYLLCAIYTKIQYMVEKYHKN